MASLDAKQPLTIETIRTIWAACPTYRTSNRLAPSLISALRRWIRYLLISVALNNSSSKELDSISNKARNRASLASWIICWCHISRALRMGCKHVAAATKWLINNSNKLSRLWFRHPQLKVPPSVMARHKSSKVSANSAFKWVQPPPTRTENLLFFRVSKNCARLNRLLPLNW